MLPVADSDRLAAEELRGRDDEDGEDDDDDDDDEEDDDDDKNRGELIVISGIEGRAVLPKPPSLCGAPRTLRGELLGILCGTGGPGVALRCDIGCAEPPTDNKPPLCCCCPLLLFPLLFPLATALVESYSGTNAAPLTFDTTPLSPLSSLSPLSPLSPPSPLSPLSEPSPFSPLLLLYAACSSLKISTRMASGSMVSTSGSTAEPEK